MENSNLKKVLATLSMSKEIEVINPKTVKGGVACYCFRCRNYSKPPILSTRSELSEG